MEHSDTLDDNKKNIGARNEYSFNKSNNLDGFSLANHAWFAKFAKLSCYTVYKAENRQSACLSVCSFCDAVMSVVSASIETRVSQNESCVFEEHEVYFYKST